MESICTGLRKDPVMIFFDPKLTDEMIRRLIYRLIIMVPVTLSILLVTILLFYKLPAAQVLDSSELELGSERELAHLLGLQDNTRILSRYEGLLYIRP